MTPRSYDEWAKLDKEIEKEEGADVNKVKENKKTTINSKKPFTDEEMLKDLNTDGKFEKCI